MFVKIILAALLTVYLLSSALAQVLIPATPPKQMMTEQDVKDLEAKRWKFMQDKAQAMRQRQQQRGSR
jgi:hypothetical protein